MTAQLARARPYGVDRPVTPQCGRGVDICRVDPDAARGLLCRPCSPILARARLVAPRGTGMSFPIVRHPSAFLPLAMSGAALAVVLGHIAIAGIQPQPDEGAAAHLWQRLMAGQLPLVVFFGVRWLPRSPGQALLNLAVQLGAAVGAAAPVYLLRW